MDESFQFRVQGKPNSDYAKCPKTRRSVTGYVVQLEGAPVAVKSAMQKNVSLSVTEAEHNAAVQCAQEMLYVKNIIEGMSLKVELPMILEIDNSGVVDLANNWTVSGGTRHMDTRLHFLCELKEEGVIKVVWISGTENTADLFTKNLHGPLFNKHTKIVCGDDEYNNHESSN